MERKTIDLWFGAFVAAGFAALLVLALKVGNLGQERATQTYLVEARFDNIGGLKVRGPVRSAGVLVGRVSEIHFDNERFQASVTLAVDKRYTFPKDTTASILTSGVLGDQYVALEPGAETTNLASGDEIQFTQSAVVLERLIGKLIQNLGSGSRSDDSGDGANGDGAGAGDSTDGGGTSE